MRCLKCGNQLAEDSAFCRYCGEAVAGENRCPACSFEMTADMMFCPQCGTQVQMKPDSQPDTPLRNDSCDVKAEKGTVLEAEPMETPRAKRKKWIVLSVFVVLLSAAFALCAVILKQEEVPEEPNPVVSESANTETVMETADSDGTVSLHEAAASVLYLEIFDENDECIGTASGFLAVSDRMLITNYHVVEDAYRIVAWTSDAERSVEANTLLAYDEVADLAVLRCDSTFWGEPLVLADSDETKQGETVYAVGYSLGIANTMSNGIISARYMDELGVDIIQTTAAISEGNSGGPLLNEDGQVLGVVCAYYIYGQNMNMAVASNTLKELLNAESEPIKLKDWTDRPAMPGYEEVEQPEPEVTPTPAPVTINSIDQVETVVNASCKDYSASTGKVLNGTLTFAVISGTEVELSYDVDDPVSADKEYLVDEVMDQILNYVVDDINQAGFPEVVNVYITVNYDFPEATEPNKQAAAYSALYDWVEVNYNETWTDGSISYWWGHSQDDWRYDYDIMLDEGDLLLRCEANNQDSRDVVYVTLYPEGTTFPVNYFYYDSLEAETADVFGSALIDASSFTEDSIIRFASVEGSTVGIEYLEEIATILCVSVLEFGDDILRDCSSETTYTIADFEFTSLRQ